MRGRGRGVGSVKSENVAVVGDSKLEFCYDLRCHFSRRVKIGKMGQGQPVSMKYSNGLESPKIDLYGP